VVAGKKWLLQKENWPQEESPMELESQQDLGDRRKVER